MLNGKVKKVAARDLKPGDVLRLLISGGAEDVKVTAVRVEEDLVGWVGYNTVVGQIGDVVSPDLLVRVVTPVR